MEDTLPNMMSKAATPRAAVKREIEKARMTGSSV